MKWLVAIATCSLAALAFTSPVLAQDDDEGPSVIYKDETEIDFEDVSVEGELRAPNGAYLVDRRQSTFNPLIKLRYDFNDEMLSSVDEVE